MPKNLWKTIIPLCCVLLVDSMSYGIVVPLIGPMLLSTGSSILPVHTSLELRNFYYSLVFGLPMFFMLLGAPLLGDISDFIGRRKALMVALLGIAVSCLVSAFGVWVNSILLLLLGRCVLGLMDSSESIAKAAIIDISKEEKVKILNMSLISLAGTVGFVLGPLLGGLLVSDTAGDIWGYETPFLIAAALALVNAASLYFTFDETFTPPKTRKFHIFRSFHYLGTAFLDSRIRLISIIFFCLQFIWGIYFQLISIMLVQIHHFNPLKIGFFMTYIALCFAGTLLIIMRILVRYLESYAIILFSILLVALAGVLVCLSQHEWIIWLSALPISMGIGLSYNTLLSIFSDSVDAESQGKIMGIATSLFASSWLLSSILGGYLSTINLHLPYVLMTLLALCLFPLANKVRKHPPKKYN